MRGRTERSDTPLRPLPNGFHDRVEGMLYGLAIGDSLGNTSESMTPGTRRARYGEITGYLPNRYLAGKRGGTPSDDTQMAFWTLEHLLRHRDILPRKLAATFASHRIFGIGSTVREFLSTYKANRRDDWRRWGRASAGNGALMRIAPLAIAPWLIGGEGEGGSPQAPLTDLTLKAASLTHNDPMSNGASVAMTLICYELLTGSGDPGQPLWWLDRWIELSTPVEGGRAYRPRGGAFRRFTGPLREFLDSEVRAAWERGDEVVDACNRWYSGAYLLETVPSVLYILMRHGADPREAILRAVNDTKDNDTIAAIVGAAVGAAHGLSRLPQEWVSGLAGQVTGDDDGTVQRLVGEAVEALR